jgi:RNA polymerase sigma factor (TIGR02999 family)
MSGPDPTAESDLPDADSLRILTEELYSSLKRLARAQRGRLRVSETLQTTALVSETYLKLSRQTCWKSRDHFLNTAAMIMRQVLVDYARSQLTAKRGGGAVHEDIDEIEAILGEPSSQVVNIDSALTRLQEVDPRLAKLVEYRFFAGYSDSEAARLLGVSARTVQRDWIKARAWLYQELQSESE